MPVSHAMDGPVLCPETEQDVCPPRSIGVEQPEEKRCSDAQRYVSRGLVLYNHGCRTGAVEMYRQALQLDAGHTLARYLLGLALNALGRHDEAYAEWRVVLSDQPQGERAAWAQRMAESLLYRTTSPASRLQCD